MPFSFLPVGPVLLGGLDGYTRYVPSVASTYMYYDTIRRFDGMMINMIKR